MPEVKNCDTCWHPVEFEPYPIPNKKGMELWGYCFARKMWVRAELDLSTYYTNDGSKIIKCPKWWQGED